MSQLKFLDKWDVAACFQAWDTSNLNSVELYVKAANKAFDDMQLYRPTEPAKLKKFLEAREYLQDLIGRACDLRLELKEARDMPLTHQRIARLIQYIELMQREETSSGFAELGRDLRQLKRYLEALPQPSSPPPQPSSPPPPRVGR